MANIRGTAAGRWFGRVMWIGIIANLALAERQQNQVAARGALLPQVSFRAAERVTRASVPALFGSKVYLQIWVKVRRGWADDAAQLRRFGYE